MWSLLAAVYSNAHARTRLTDHLCGVSIAPIDAQGAPKELPAAIRAQLCGWSNGLGYFIGGEATGVIDDLAATPGSLGGLALLPIVGNERALCAAEHRRGALGRCDTHEGRHGRSTRQRQSAWQAGHHPCMAAAIRFCRPTASRAYVGLNKIVEGERSPTRYVEVVNGNHFDSFIPLFGGAIPVFGPNTLIPMHYYFEQALSLMRDHLLDKGGTALPPSQVLVGSVANKPWDTLAKARLDMPDLASSPPPDKSITVSTTDLEHSLRLAVLGCGSAWGDRADQRPQSLMLLD